MKRLPASLHSSSVSEKLVWLHIHSNPGQHSARSLAADLGGSSRTWANALSGLVKDKLLVVEKAPAGIHGGQYRVQVQAIGPAPETHLPIWSSEV